MSGPTIVWGQKLKGKNVTSCTQQVFDALPIKRSDAISHMALRDLLLLMDSASFSNAVCALKRNGTIEYERTRFYFRNPSAKRPRGKRKIKNTPIQIAIANLIATLPLIRIAK